MRFETAPSPHLPPQSNVASVMQQVLLALLPALLMHLYFFGLGIAFNIAIATGVALGSEAAMLRLRGRPLPLFLGDYSAAVTAVLLAFALPPLTPWWVTATGAAFAIVFAKHVYGGLGFNPFNPAMAGYALLLVSFPADLSFFPPPRGLAEAGIPSPGAFETLVYVLTGNLPDGLGIDGIAMATPLDKLQSELGQMRMISEIRTGVMFGSFAGRGWEWINLAIAAGGLWLLYRGVIRWHIPVSVLLGLGGSALLLNLFAADTHASATFHLLSGAAMLGAFFIATDPVSAATSTRGRLIYGAGIGVLTYAIRGWGKYPDGVAFAVLLMNMAVPAIDYFTVPRVYGHERR